MTEKLSLFLHKGALAQLHIETVLAEKGKNTANMAEVLGLGLGVYENIVKIDDHPLVEDGIENLEHHVGEGGRGVGEAEGDDVELKVSIPTAEGGLMSVWLIDTLLVVPRDQVQLGKVLCTSKAVDHFINSG